jgi:DNA-directed RNA polymerase specialized sigma24 family protein
MDAIVLFPGRAAPVATEGSVTLWIGRLRAGDPDAAGPLWERYFQRLVGLARARLRGAPRRVSDEEDVALSAFESFCRAAAEGRFPRLGDRDDLWRLLVTFTARKALHLVRDQGRQKRGGGAPRPGEEGVDQLIGDEPTPEFAAQVAEECRRLLDSLGDPGLRALALWKMEGYTNDEIAARLDCAPRTVERKLRLIRRIWEQEGAR